MPNLAVLTPFRKLAAVAPFTRNVDALFQDFFLTPMSLDSTATGPVALDDDGNTGMCPAGPLVPDGGSSPLRSTRPALAPAADDPA